MVPTGSEKINEWSEKKRQKTIFGLAQFFAAFSLARTDENKPAELSVILIRNLSNQAGKAARQKTVNIVKETEIKIFLACVGDSMKNV